jgi:hypothetical protein
LTVRLLSFDHVIDSNVSHSYCHYNEPPLKARKDGEDSHKYQKAYEGDFLEAVICYIDTDVYTYARIITETDNIMPK